MKYVSERLDGIFVLCRKKIPLRSRDGTRLASSLSVSHSPSNAASLTFLIEACTFTADQALVKFS